MSAVIHQEVDFKANPQRVYEALTDAKCFSAFTGLPAEIHGGPGGAFSCYGGQIAKRILHLVPNQRIVQAWRVSMWPEGLFSIAQFEIKGQGTGT
jgi:activator of HSP90 ATPase